MNGLGTRERVDGTSDTSRHGRRLVRRMILRRADGRIYLNRWGIGHKKIGSIFLHRMDAPDPGIDLHNHPWWFASLVLWGGYIEERANSDDAPALARHAEQLDVPRWGVHWPRGTVVRRRPGSFRSLDLGECHTITGLLRSRCWTLVVTGPTRRTWGFFLPTGFVDEDEYDRTVRVDRRDLWNELG